MGIDLIPISTHQLGNASPILKRQLDETPDNDNGARLELLDYDSFYWGSQSDGSVIYANLTLFFKDEFESIISMERFDTLLKSVTCGARMTLEFKDKPAFTKASSIWNWVNDDVNNTFVLVVPADTCGVDTDRRPFVVHDLDFDAPNFKVYLQTEAKEWTDVAKTYAFHMGYAPGITAPSANSTSPTRRDTDFTMSLASNFNKNLFNQKVSGVDLSVDCSNCGTTGRLLVDFDLDVGWSGPKVSMKVNPQDVAAFLQLSMSASGTLSKAYRWEKTLVSIPIEGIKVGDWAKIGAFLDVDVGFSLEEWTGEVETSFGAKMALSNAAVVEIDVFDPDNGKFSGWNPALTALPFTLGAKVSGQAQLYAQPSISLSATALKHGIEMSLDLRMPYIELDFDAMVNTAGVCGSKKTIGVDLDASAGVDLSVQVAKAGQEANPLWEKTLFNQEWPLFSKCYSFGPENAGSGGGGGGSKPPPKKPKSKMPPKPKPTPKPKPKETPPAKKLKPKPPKTTDKPKPASKKSTKKPTTTPLPKTSTDEKENGGKKTTKTSSTLEKTDRTTKTTKPTSHATTNSGTKSETTLSRTSGTSTDASTTGTASGTETTSETGITLETRTTSAIGTTSTTISQSTTSKATSSLTSTFTTSTRYSNSTTRSTHRQPGSSSSSSTESGTFTSSATSSSTSSSASSCPTSGCDDGCDPVDGGVDSFDVEARDLELWKRAKKEVTLKCGTTKSWVLEADSYPRPSDQKAMGTRFTVSPWVRIKAPQDLANYEMVPEAKRNTTVNCAYDTEHVYEANWIADFMLNLTKAPNQWTCDDIDDVFFTKVTNTGGKDTWAGEIMSRLGSTKNQNLLTMLSSHAVNSRKFSIYTEGNVIDQRRFLDTTGLNKMKALAEVGRAMNYMSFREVGEIMKKTVEDIEDAMLLLGSQILVKNPGLAAKIAGGAGDAAFLKTYHRTFIRDHITAGNDRVWTRFTAWALLAKQTLLKEPAGPKTRHYVNFLSGLTGLTQVRKEVPGFNVRAWL